ncbi:SMC-Scp complex subunit ScpB [Leucothrix mucor]|uniref:SMC-Scp complex subunit ScpB n=1 Tax=Leucothrix mucor TaxID=45248 RepID=UPI0003B4CE59|nr:SMC-Scp complex subunit ScpB [Leucothrix mucor]
MEQKKLLCILEAILISAEKPLSVERLMQYFPPEQEINKGRLRDALSELAGRCYERGFELRQVAGGYRFQTREEYKEWVSRHWDERPPRYSRALLEILALIMYRQPITRAEIEEVRGVAVSSNIIRTLQERDWIKVIGHKEVPGRPEMFGTTPELLNYFNLSSLDELPDLAAIRNLDEIYPDLPAMTKAKITPEAGTEDDADAEAKTGTTDDEDADLYA